MLAVSISGFVALLLDVTLEEAVVHHGSRALVAGDYGRLRAVLTTGLLVDAIVGLAVAGGVFLSAGFLVRFLGGGELEPVLLRLAALIPLFSTINGTTGAMLLLARRPDMHQWAATISAALRLPAVAIAVVMGGAQSVLIGLAAAAGVGGVIQAVISWHFGPRQWKRELREGSGRKERGLSRTLFIFGMYTTISSTVSAGTSRLISIILGTVSGARAVGLLEVASLPVTLAASATTPLRLAMLPEHGRLWANNETSVLRRSARGYVLIAGFGGALAAAVGWFLMPTLVLFLYSDEFASAILPARILLVAAWASLVTGWAKSLPGIVGKPQVRTLVSVLELGITVGLVTLLAQHGATGGAIAISGAAVLLLGVWLLVMKRLLAERPIQSRQGNIE